MASLSFDLGSADELIELFSYPNRPDSCETLVETILHWVMQMIARDGYGAVANANMHIDGEEYFLDLDGPTEMVLGYMEKLPLFLAHGLNALEVIKAIRKDDEFKKREWPTWVDPPLKNRLWDPMDRDRWRFFLPFGMAMLRQKMVNFFHYPPMRLLDEMRDYLADPVPVRLIELMKANGIKTDQEAWLYSTVMDGAPIAAPDDEGTIYNEDKSGKAGTEEREVHLLPIDRFYDYQKCQTELLLRSLCPVGEGFTIPIVIYGSSALKSFNLIWPDAKLSRGANPATFVIILEGKQTPVLCSGHPYAFFAQSQTEVGVGWMKPEAWSRSPAASFP